MRQMGQESGKEKEGKEMGARREDWPPTLEHREREKCASLGAFTRAKRDVGEPVCPEVGQVSMVVPQSTSLCLYVHAHTASQCTCNPSVQRGAAAAAAGCCALLSLNYARRTSSSASEPFFLLASRFSSLPPLLPLPHRRYLPSPTVRSSFLFPGQARDPPPCFP